MSSIDLIRVFQSMGCQDAIKCSVASMVYLDLKEDQTITTLEKHYDNELDIIYFLGSRESYESNFFLPASSCGELDLKRIEQIQEKFSKKHKNITIAICDPSSTILYYNMTNGFIEK